MPSHLTRHVFRCLIANEHILHSGCLRRHAVSRLRAQHRAHVGSTDDPVHQQRSFFNFPQAFVGSARDERGPRTQPGLDVMMDYTRKRRMQARLPDVRDVDVAIHRFLQAKRRETVRTLPDVHANLLVANLEYVRASVNAATEKALDPRSDMPHFETSLQDVGKLLYSLKTPYVPAHLELARVVAEFSQDRTLASSYPATFGLIATLCRAGQPAQARDLLIQSKLLDVSASEETQEFEGESFSPAQSKTIAQRGRIAQREIVEAFMEQGDEAGMNSTVNLSSQNDLLSDARVIALFIKLYSQRQDLSKMEKWIDAFLDPKALRYIHEHRFLGQKSAASRFSHSRKAVRLILDSCSPKEFQKLGKRVVRELLVINPIKPVWDEVLAWDFAQHKSVDELSRQLDIMLSMNSDRARECSPDTTSINRFIEVAIAASDPYLAERLISLGKDRGIQTDARTLVLQLQYRLKVNDIDGALIAYKHLQSEDTSGLDDVPAVNRLIVALCQSTRHDFETIMNVAGDLSDRGAAFEPEAVRSLALLHLRRDELQDVQDLVKTHASTFSSAERASLRSAIKDFCLDDATPPAVMWDAYNVLRNDFDEMPRSERTEIMENCFHRKRPDMAIHLFSHMRTHSRDDTYPDASTYIAAFNGAAKLKDRKTLSSFHNQLKIDPQVQVTTGVRNALMKALAATSQPGSAMRVWEEIAASNEGPNYTSVHTALRICEHLPFGDARAGAIWQKLQKDEIDLDQSLWAAYVAALVANGSVKDALRLLEAAVNRNEVYADELVVGRLYNASMTSGQRQSVDHVQDWAKLEYPEIWEALQTKWKMTVDEFGIPMRIFDLGDEVVSR